MPACRQAGSLPLRHPACPPHKGLRKRCLTFVPLFFKMFNRVLAVSMVRWKGEFVPIRA